MDRQHVDSATLRTLGAVFFAGIVSLLLELSLLREFIYIFGSTAKSNALIISVFLVGLAAGSYAGTHRLFKASATESSERFAQLQVLNILYIAIFFLTKRYFVYYCAHPKIVMVYFLASVFAPSFIAGLAYAYTVKILHEKGERIITWVYGISTLGSVIGGMAHGLWLVPVFGIRSTYVAAVGCAALAALLVNRSGNLRRNVLLLILMCVVVLAIRLDPSRRLWNLPNVLFSKDSEFGIVEIWKLSPEKARKMHDRISFGQRPFDFEGRQAIDMKINNVHQAYNLPADRRIHENWARTSIEIVDRKAKVLLMGYASGVTADAFLALPQVEQLDIIENCDPIVEAGKIFFPDEFGRVMNDRRARLIVDDFRGYVRFAKEKYDVIALDHSLQDPYSIGFFTTEFFEQLKSRLTDGGVVLLLGEGLSWNTNRLPFPYIYKNNEAHIEPHVRKNCQYLALKPFPDRLAGRYTLVDVPAEQGGLVYSDDLIWRY